MVRILCIGDSHVPVRAKDLPVQIYEKLDELTVKSPFHYTFFTGDLINFPKLIDYLNQKTIKNFFNVIGNMDYYYGNHDAPNYQKLVVCFEDNDKIILGLTHGAQVSPRGDHDQLGILAQERRYNIMVSGHTHKEEVFLTNKGILLINPGSVTGAWSFIASGTPSFIELSINVRNKEISVQLYQINKQTRKIENFEYKFTFKKNQIFENNKLFFIKD
jgi:vacuolar protein sorting-associated protein 29